ncbi:MAG: endonuclease domain-containing protein [Alphaproteobacteria bacterium]|nr:endonuclease domain-containing protein [Alphaproteobacteria bacterium]
MHKYKGNLVNFARSNRRAGNLAEALLWNKLKQDKLGFTFTRQKPIGNYIADFYCHAKKLVIEIDGFTHGTKYEYDRERDAYMESLGIRVIRITDHDVKRNMSNVLYWIKYNLENCPPVLPPPPAPPVPLPTLSLGAESPTKFSISRGPIGM